MSSQADENQGFVLGVVFFVIALVISLVIGLSIHQVNKRHAAKPVAVAAVADNQFEHPKHHLVL